MYTLGCFQCAFCRIAFVHMAIYLRFCASNIFGGRQNVHLGRATVPDRTLRPGDSLGRPIEPGPQHTDAPQAANPATMKHLGESFRLTSRPNSSISSAQALGARNAPIPEDEEPNQFSTSYWMKLDGRTTQAGMCHRPISSIMVITSCWKQCEYDRKRPDDKKGLAKTRRERMKAKSSGSTSTSLTRCWTWRLMVPG